MRYPNAQQLKQAELQARLLTQQLKPMQERQAERDARRRAELAELWSGFSVGDVVLLGPRLTRDVYGVDLANDGEVIQLDAELIEIWGDKAKVRMKLQACDLIRLIYRTDIECVSDKPLTHWGDAKKAITQAAERDGVGYIKPREVTYWDVAGDETSP
jgi:hypothetical protein